MSGGVIPEQRRQNATPGTIRKKIDAIKHLQKTVGDKKKKKKNAGR